MGITRFIFVALLCAYSSFSFALKISGTPSGVSYYDPGTSTTTTPGSTAPANTTPTIYGGIAGADTDGACNYTKDGVNTCNNCDRAINVPPAQIDVRACNTTRVYTSLNMVIPLTDTGSAGIAHLKINNATSSTYIDTGNSLTAVTVSWGSICNAAQSGATCDPTSLTSDYNLTGTIWIETDGVAGPSGSEPQLTVLINIWGQTTLSTGIDSCDSTSSSGVCNIRAYPGDEKIYITEAKGSGSYPASGLRKTAKLRVFASTTDYDHAVPTLADQEIDLKVDDNGDLTDRRVKGLTNGTGYFIRVGTVDYANNVDAITSDANLNSSEADCMPSVSPGPPWTAPTSSMNCRYYATPDEVLGLLSKDMNCFIATAAYGSQTAKYLDMLREFRLRKLLPYQWGKKFVLSYYKYGPYAAQYITDHPWLKPVTRAFLWPVIGFTWLVLHYGWTTALGVYAVAFLILVSFLYLVRNQIQLRRGRLSAR